MPKYNANQATRPTAPAPDAPTKEYNSFHSLSVRRAASVIACSAVLVPRLLSQYPHTASKGASGSSEAPPSPLLRPVAETTRKTRSERLVSVAEPQGCARGGGETLGMGQRGLICTLRACCSPPRQNVVSPRPRHCLADPPCECETDGVSAWYDSAAAQSISQRHARGSANRAE